VSTKQPYNGPQKKVGETLDWTSQSAGYTKRKTGVIVAIVKANEDAFKAVRNHGDNVSTRRILSARVSTQDRYLVAVTVVKGEPPMYYLPGCKAIDRGISAGKKPEDAKRPEKRAA
jgi:hypothetical protein